MDINLDIEEFLADSDTSFDPYDDEYYKIIENLKRVSEDDYN